MSSNRKVTLIYIYIYIYIYIVNISLYIYICPQIVKLLLYTISIFIYRYPMDIVYTRIYVLHYSI